MNFFRLGSASLFLAITLPVSAQQIVGPAGTYTSSAVLAASGPVTIQSPWVGPAGVYQITLPAGAIVTQTATSITITWSGPTPTPPPPTPPPTPAPTGPLYAVVIFDAKATTQPTADQSAVQKSTTIAKALAQYSCTWSVGDVASPAFASWAPAAVKAGIPALVILEVDSNGKGILVEAVPLPATGTEAAIVAEVKKTRGQ